MIQQGTAMSIHAALHHVTHYRYDRLVQLGPQVVRLRPAPHSRSRILSYSLKVEPAQHFINWQQDPFANYQARLMFPEPTQEFKVTVDLVAEMAVFNPFDFFLEPEAEQIPFAYGELEQQELAPYLAADPLTPLLEKYLAGVDRSATPTVDFLVALNQRVHQDVRYLIRMEPGVQTPEETLGKASGSCRDSAWLLVQLLRHLGLAARFVSGYLIQLKPDVKSLDGPSGTDHDFTDLHAWCEVYLPGAGWVGLDATSGLFAGEGHIPLACTPQPGGAAPIEGLVDPCEVTFSHEMSVSRILETPRVTLPYSDAQWERVLALGDAVDASLQEGDVRLTMGGEPTFVSIDDRDAPEWNTTALGPRKRERAIELLHRLRDQYGQGGFLHCGQGKWYPGEQLPRWALSALWRTDGEPVWHNPARLADERTPQHYTQEDADRFIRQLAEELGITDSHVMPALEDTWYHLWREQRLPSNVTPQDARLDDSLERARLGRVFGQGLARPVGYVLPLQAVSEVGTYAELTAEHAPHWATSPWHLREGQLYLLPGDSPVGLRLPLDRLPWVAADDRAVPVPVDPFEPREELDSTGADQPAQDRPGAQARAAAGRDAAACQKEGTAARHRRRESENLAGGGMVGMHEDADDDGMASGQLRERKPRLYESAPWIVRTALCVEARDTRRTTGIVDPKDPSKGYQALYVFMPPVVRLEDYLDLVAAIERTAEALDVAVVLEGYLPPRDPRLTMLQVTPDPGVIEVNIQPARTWREIVSRTEFLYDAAFHCRLSAEKFMTDGRHTGTGGGNHFVMGGATPDESPFLRRPDVLASLLSYWHNHPSLSYLFSGLFIGPTSQAPRVDEARNDQLYELEIALAEIHGAQAKYGEQMQPWLVDRSLRNILIDVTGNTHRSEFCIDKLYSPDSSTGRLGLLELRAFEMPPHARMSVVQQLLMRALIARFWREPYRAPLARWGTELHDRFMLPTFVQADFADVMSELRAAGFAFEDAWFAPHFEFRFPHIGDMEADGVTLTLRSALEPWHVMGEESGGGGTVRYVDSSLERLEVEVRGFNPARHTITCNGVPVPLQPTGKAGVLVAGVRYKAWNPPSALHPSIGVHAPLTFDVVDTWMGRSLGGCSYHVAHPGGRNYETLPVNAYEAESRRLARFFRLGHTPGALDLARNALPTSNSMLADREFPFTLDLRRHPAASRY